MNNLTFGFTLVLIGLVFAFLFWDVAYNSGNIFWTPTIRAFDYFSESDEQRIQKFKDNAILLSFLDRFPDSKIFQELEYSGKFQYYTHSNDTFTAQLKIWDTLHHVHYSFSCHDTLTGLDHHQRFIKSESQMDFEKCE